MKKRRTFYINVYEKDSGGVTYGQPHQHRSDAITYMQWCVDKPLYRIKVRMK